MRHKEKKRVRKTDEELDRHTQPHKHTDRICPNINLYPIYSQVDK